jgi:hypothetical protein
VQQVDYPVKSMPKSSVEQWLVHEEKRLGRWPLMLLITLMIQSISYFLYPGLFPWELEREIRYQTVVALIENPLTTEPVSEPAVRHRLLLPLMAKLLCLHGSSFVVLVFLGTYLFLLASLVLLRRSLPLKQSTVGLLLLATTTAATSTTQWLMIQDTWAGVAVMGCLLWRKPVWLIGPLLYVGMLADERCLSTVPLLLLWFHLEDPFEQTRKRLALRLACIAFACLCFTGTYLYIHQLAVTSENATYFGAKDNSGFVKMLLMGDVLRTQLPYIPTGVWHSLRAGWVLILIWCWHERRNTWLIWWITGGLMAVLCHAVLVTDISRVSGLVFPCMLLAMVQLHRSLPRIASSAVMFCVLANLLAPQYQIIMTYSKLMPPLLLRIF